MISFSLHPTPLDSSRCSTSRRYTLIVRLNIQIVALLVSPSLSPSLRLVAFVKKWKDTLIVRFKIIVAHFQIVTTFPAVLDVQWPEAFNRYDGMPNALCVIFVVCCFCVDLIVFCLSWLGCFLSCLALSCLALSCLALPCLAMSRLALPCLALPGLV